MKIWKGVQSGDYHVRYSDGVTFRLNTALSSIEVTSTQAVTDADLASYLLGPVLGILLTLKGFTCLHGSAVNVCGRAVVFAGVEGSGKSTTAAIFAERGHAVLTDDIAVIDRTTNGLHVRPGYPALNLLPDSVTALYGSPDALPAADPAVEKQQLLLRSEALRFQAHALPLGAVFMLDSDENSSGNFVERFSPREALIQLAANTYANRMLDAKMRAAEFQMLGSVVKSVPILKLRQRAQLDKGGLERLYTAVHEAARDAIRGECELRIAASPSRQ